MRLAGDRGEERSALHSAGREHVCEKVRKGQVPRVADLAQGMRYPQFPGALAPAWWLCWVRYWQPEMAVSR